MTQQMRCRSFEDIFPLVQHDSTFIFDTRMYYSIGTPCTGISAIDLFPYERAFTQFTCNDNGMTLAS